MNSPEPVLDTPDRVAEVLFGLIMVLTFTGSLSVATAGRDDVRAMLVGALGCNLAWGIIDGVLYVMGRLAAKGQGLGAFRAVRAAADPAEARRHIVEALPPPIVSVLEPAEIETLYQRLELPEPPARATLDREDWIGAVAVCLLVFLSTFPVAIPFIVMHQAVPALRVSNGIALIMLFVAGVVYGKSVQRSPWSVGASMALLGGLLSGLAIALGG